MCSYAYIKIRNSSDYQYYVYGIYRNLMYKWQHFIFKREGQAKKKIAETSEKSRSARASNICPSPLSARISPTPPSLHHRSPLPTIQFSGVAMGWS